MGPDLPRREMSPTVRTFFEPEEEQEFQASQELLVRRLEAWASRRGRQVDLWVAEAAWDYRNASTRDGRLALWTPANIAEFLLEWMPAKLTVLPGDPVPDGPGTLDALLCFLDETGLRDPRGGGREQIRAALEQAAGGFADAMADRERWGIAKFWTTTAAENGVDIHDPAAMQRFIERVRRGQVAYDEALVERIARRRMAALGGGGGITAGPVERALPQLPVVLPGLDELATAAEASPVVRQLVALSRWAGQGAPVGRVLTGTGKLRLADARELVALLDTGDVVDPEIGGQVHRTRSSADLGRLDLLFEWAKKIRVVRVAKGRLLPVAKAAPLLADPLSLWARAFDALHELRDPLLSRRGGWTEPSMLWDLYQDVLPDIEATLYSLPMPMPWPSLRDSVRLHYDSAFNLGDASAERRLWWLRGADADLRRVLEVWESLGAVERRTGPADPSYSAALDRTPDAPAPPPDALPGGVGVLSTTRVGGTFAGPAGTQPQDAASAQLAALLGAGTSRSQAEHEDRDPRTESLRSELTAGPVELLTLTGLGSWAVRGRLLVEGRDAPLIGELRHASAAELLGVLAEHYPTAAAFTELEGWITAHGGRPAALDALLDGLREVPFRSRLAALLHVLRATLLPADSERLLSSARSDPKLAPAALSLLSDTGGLDLDGMTEREHVLVMAESLLCALEATGSQTVIETFQHLSPDQLEATRAAVASSGHPDHEGLAELHSLVFEPLRRSGVTSAQLGRLRSTRASRAAGKSGGRRRRR